MISQYTLSFIWRKKSSTIKSWHVHHLIKLRVYYFIVETHTILSGTIPIKKHTDYIVFKNMLSLSLSLSLSHTHTHTLSFSPLPSLFPCSFLPPFLPLTFSFYRTHKPPSQCSSSCFSLRHLISRGDVATFFVVFRDNFKPRTHQHLVVGSLVHVCDRYQYKDSITPLHVQQLDDRNTVICTIFIHKYFMFENFMLDLLMFIHVQATPYIVLNTLFIFVVNK